MKFTIYQASRQGGRKNNQDRVAYSYSRDALLMVVADGMGGHMHGEIAAQIAVQTLTDQFQKMAKPRLDVPMAFLADTTPRAHFSINDYAVEQDLLEIPHSTIVAAVVQGRRAMSLVGGDWNPARGYLRAARLLTVLGFFVSVGFLAFVCLIIPAVVQDMASSSSGSS